MSTPPTKSSQGALKGLSIMASSTAVTNPSVVTTVTTSDSGKSKKMGKWMSPFSEEEKRNSSFSSEVAKYFRTDQKDKDIVLTGLHGIEVPVHRSLLMARSPVFRAMFESGLLTNQDMLTKVKKESDVKNNEGAGSGRGRKRKKQEEVEAMDVGPQPGKTRLTVPFFENELLTNVQDIFLEKQSKAGSMGDEALQAMINYLYTDQVPSMQKLADKLLILADRFQIKGLMLMCQEYLLQHLDAKNVAHYMVLADMVHADALKRGCLEFAAENAIQVTSSPDWRENLKKRPLLALDAFDLLVKKTKVAGKDFDPSACSSSTTDSRTGAQKWSEWTE